jgi:hypothetical protein
MVRKGACSKRGNEAGRTYGFLERAGRRKQEYEIRKSKVKE